VLSRTAPTWTGLFLFSLGDSHRGYRVVGTENSLFREYRYSDGRTLELIQGTEFSESPFDVVLGATVADQLGYKSGDSVVISHGTGRVTLNDHSNLPFTVSGILAATGTPVDTSLFVSLRGITAIHLGWEDGVERREVTVEEALRRDLTPESITAAYVGLTNRSSVLTVQRAINDYADEPLTAVLPGVALYELWKIMSTAERSLSFIAGFVVVVGLISLLTAQLAVLEQRRREMALLRSLGASARDLFRLLLMESFAVTFAGCITGLVLLYGVQAAAAGPLGARGIYLDWGAPSPEEWALLGIVLVLGVINGLIPAAATYRKSLTDGMTVRN
jgi:putative ABC transport system permease protein